MRPDPECQAVASLLRLALRAAPCNGSAVPSRSSLGHALQGRASAPESSPAWALVERATGGLAESSNRPSPATAGDTRGEGRRREPEAQGATEWVAVLGMALGPRGGEDSGARWLLLACRRPARTPPPPAEPPAGRAVGIQSAFLRSGSGSSKVSRANGRPNLLAVKARRGYSLVVK